MANITTAAAERIAENYTKYSREKQNLALLLDGGRFDVSTATIEYTVVSEKRDPGDLTQVHVGSLPLHLKDRSRLITSVKSNLQQLHCQLIDDIALITSHLSKDQESLEQ